MKATAERLNSGQVITRTKTGMPRLFTANVGAVNERYYCYCPKGSGQGCSHEVALMTLLHQEAAAMQAKPAHVVA